MTRALPLQPSPQFLTYEMFSRQVQADPTCAPYSPVAQTPSHSHGSKNITKVKLKRPSRPTYSKMIDEAVFEKSERRKGASLPTIKKYLQQKYGIDVKKSAKRICKCIRESVINGGHLKQMTGNGANGSFALTQYARKMLQVEKEKSLLVKSRSRKIKSAPTPAAKIKVRKNSRADSRLRDTPVTRMSVR